VQNTNVHVFSTGAAILVNLLIVSVQLVSNQKCNSVYGYV